MQLKSVEVDSRQILVGASYTLSVFMWKNLCEDLVWAVSKTIWLCIDGGRS